MTHECDYACNHDPIKPATAPLPATPAPTEQSGELPPLPEPHLRRGEGLTAHYSKKQMRDYARAALAARQAPAEAPNFGPIGFGLTDRQVLLETADLLMEQNWRGDLAETLRDMARQAPDSRDATQAAATVPGAK